MPHSTPRKFRSTLREIEFEHYISAHSTPEADDLRSVASRAEQELVYPRMVSGHLQGLLLTFLVRMLRPKRILELGTFAAYATIALARGLEDGGRVVTVEIDPDLEPFIRKSLRDAGVDGKVDLLFGDATALVGSGQIDLSETTLVYIDANKRHYTEYYEAIVPKLGSGAFVLADNVLWGGKVTDPDARDLQTEGIRAFNDLVRDDPRVEQVILPIRDGLTLISVL